jgi:hypothetical protein
MKSLQTPRNISQRVILLPGRKPRISTSTPVLPRGPACVLGLHTTMKSGNPSRPPPAAVSARATPAQIRPSSTPAAQRGLLRQLA